MVILTKDCFLIDIKILAYLLVIFFYRLLLIVGFLSYVKESTSWNSYCNMWKIIFNHFFK